MQGSNNFDTNTGGFPKDGCSTSRENGRRDWGFDDFVTTFRMGGLVAPTNLTIARRAERH